MKKFIFLNFLFLSFFSITYGLTFSSDSSDKKLKPYYTMRDEEIARKVTWIMNLKCDSTLQCEQNRYKMIDTLLNQVYTRIMKYIKSEFHDDEDKYLYCKQTMIDMERSWIKYRDITAEANCIAFYRKPGNDIKVIIAKTELTIIQIDDILEYEDKIHY